jgi:hypothetical protein
MSLFPFETKRHFHFVLQYTILNQRKCPSLTSCVTLQLEKKLPRMLNLYLLVHEQRVHARNKQCVIRVIESMPIRVIGRPLGLLRKGGY